MKITIIGSTQYLERFETLKGKLEAEGHEVKIPAFDHHPEFDELQVCEYNRSLIEWADKIYCIWDQRSVGTVFDFGMVFAMKKPLEIYYIELKTFAGVMRKYEEKFVSVA